MSNQIHQIHQILQKAQSDKLISGMSYSLINSQNIEMRFEGEIPTDDDVRLNPSLIYDVASLTQVVATVTRIFQLISVHKINIEDTVSKYLPGFAHDQVKIKHLITHTSGFPIGIADPVNKTGLEYIDSLYDLDLEFEPGTKVQYSSLNMVVLGLIIRTVDGSIDRSVQNNILYPLAMTNTGYNLNRPKIRFVPTRKDARRGQIQGQVEDFEGLILNGESGSAGLFSTLSDLTVFLEMMINHGSYQEKEILDPQIFGYLKNFNHQGQSLGWRRFELDDDIFYFASATGLIAFDIEHENGLVILTDYIGDERQRWDLHRKLLKVLANNAQGV